MKKPRFTNKNPVLRISQTLRIILGVRRGALIVFWGRTRVNKYGGRHADNKNVQGALALTQMGAVWKAAGAPTQNTIGANCLAPDP